MAVVVVNDIQGGDQDMYESVNPRVMPEGRLPDGCQLHVAGPVEGGWRVITVWDSDEQFQQFRDSTLIPAMQEAGMGDRIAPRIETNPAFRVLTA